jgi:hypothetical protein
VVALASVNVLGAVLFAGVYAVAGATALPPVVFLVVLGLAFVATTALWVRAERRQRRLDPLRRLGRGAAGLVAVVVGLPVAVLLPLFWLESKLPPDAVGGLHLGPTMALVLIGLALVVAVNVVGAAVTVAAALGRRGRGAPPSG